MNKNNDGEHILYDVNLRYWYCKKCNVTTSSEIAYQMHLYTSEHKDIIQLIKHKTTTMRKESLCPQVFCPIL